MKTIVILGSLLLLGCAADMMETRGDTVKLFGQKETRGGVIRYLNTGMDSWRKRRRANAEGQMKQYCKGPYRIVAEGPRSKFGADMPIGKSVSFEVDQYWYISFDCESQ